MPTSFSRSISTIRVANEPTYHTVSPTCTRTAPVPSLSSETSPYNFAGSISTYMGASTGPKISSIGPRTCLDPVTKMLPSARHASAAGRLAWTTTVPSRHVITVPASQSSSDGETVNELREARRASRDDSDVSNSS